MPYPLSGFETCSLFIFKRLLFSLNETYNYYPKLSRFYVRVVGDYRAEVPEFMFTSQIQHASFPNLDKPRLLQLQFFLKKNTSMISKTTSYSFERPSFARCIFDMQFEDASWPYAFLCYWQVRFSEKFISTIMNCASHSFTFRIQFMSYFQPKSRPNWQLSELHF